MIPKDNMPVHAPMIKSNGTTVNGKASFKQNDIQQPRIKRSKGLRF